MRRARFPNSTATTLMLRDLEMFRHAASDVADGERASGRRALKGG